MKKTEISLLEIAKVFLTIGTIGFGGGLAIIALIQDYCVEKRKWLSQEEYTHGVALGQFLGPFAVNAAIFVGYRTRGLKGAIISLISFLTPSITAVIVLSGLYNHYHKVPALQSALNGIGPCVIALIIYAAYQMGKNRMKSIEPILLTIITIFLSFYLKLQVITILFSAILYGYLKVRFFEKVAKE